MERVSDDIPVKGEGNHKAAQTYNERGEAFVQENPDQVKKAADKAKNAMEGAEAKTLKEAHDIALDKART